MPDNANISAINLKEILCRICKRARWLGQLELRRACLLAAQTPSEADISDADRETLRMIGDGREALDRLHKDPRLTAITRRFHNGAADQIHREECDRLKCSSHRQTALQVARDTFLSAVVQVVSGFTKPTSEEYSDNLFARFCCWLLDDTGSAPWELERAAEILDTPDFRTELLNKLWKECPEEAKELHLPKPGGEQGDAAPRALQGRVELGRREHAQESAGQGGPAIESGITQSSPDQVSRSMDHAMPVFNAPQWLVDAAGRISEAVRSIHAMQHVREMVRRWNNQYVRGCRREEHKARLRAEPRLRDLNTMPPEALADPENPWLCIWNLDGVKGWIPEDLLFGTYTVGLPFPLPSRPLTREEKYAVVGVIHDRICVGREPINPWQSPDRIPGGWSRTIVGIHLTVGGPYRTLGSYLDSIREADRTVVLRIVDETLAELTQAIAVPFPPTQAEERKQPKQTPLADLQAAVTALRDTVNKMLDNTPPWTWKQAKAWLTEQHLEIHNRESWRKKFGTEPPRTRGNPSFVNEADLNKAIRKELQAHNRAFDLIDKVAERTSATRRQ